MGRPIGAAALSAMNLLVLYRVPTQSAGIGTYLDSNDRRPIRTIVFIVFTAGLIGFLFGNKTHVALTDFFQTIGAEAILKSRRDPIHVLLRDPDLPAPATIASTTE